jgi:nucleoside-diphosphate-sugar epimerase
MKALVTGGCGFIGAHLVKKLVDEGAEVTVVDDLSSGDISNLTDKNLKVRAVIPSLVSVLHKSESREERDAVVITGDFVDAEVLSHFVDGEYTHVFHLAANPRVGFSVEFPAISTETNLMKTVELLSACRKANIDRFVFASSSSVYGDVSGGQKVDATHEDITCNPNSPYGLQKFVCELFMKQFSDLYNIDSVALRFFNVYGPGCTGDNPYATAVAAWCDKLNSKEMLRSDGDGEQTRDMVYVTDVANALYTCSTHKDLSGFQYYNIGTESAVSNNEILKMLDEKVGDFGVRNAPERPGDVKHTLAAVGKITGDTGWTPKETFESGLDKTLLWWGLSNG